MRPTDFESLKVQGCLNLGFWFRSISNADIVCANVVFIFQHTKQPVFFYLIVTWNQTSLYKRIPKSELVGLILWAANLGQFFCPGPKFEEISHRWPACVPCHRCFLCFCLQPDWWGCWWKHRTKGSLSMGCHALFLPRRGNRKRSFLDVLSFLSFSINYSPRYGKVYSNPVMHGSPGSSSWA